MKPIDLVYRTLFAELVQRSMDATFQSEFPANGNFVKVPVKGREYWYFDGPSDGERKRRYVGPVSDEEVTGRVESFRQMKASLKARRKLVSTLVREAGLPAPERFTGDVVAALEKAGFFRLRGVLIGTVAFQTYGGHLGIRLPGSALQTGDADFAQFHSVSQSVEDSLPPIMDILHSVDPTFREIPSMTDGRRTTQYINSFDYKVEFLTPNRGGDKYEGRPAPMPSLGGASALPMRFLDFLIHSPVRTVMLHRSGVPVTVPAPERYAVHKLIVASRRKEDPNGFAKREKDLSQALVLARALEVARASDSLAEVYVEACSRGPQWREGIEKGLSLMPPEDAEAFKSVLARGMDEIGEHS